MKTLSIDIETFSSAPLTKCGVYKYVEAPDFGILLFGYSVDNGPVHVVDIVCGEKVPAEIIEALIDDTVVKYAHNSSFERICLSRFLGYPTGEYLDPKSWHCTMVWAATLGLPLSLEGVGLVTGVEKQKLTEGKDLIRYFCIPCNSTSTNGGRTRNLPTDAPDKWERFKAYNRRDVETEMAIQKKLSKFPVPESVWGEYHLDQKINDRGVALDMNLVRHAIEADKRSHSELTRLMQELTELDNPNSVAQMKQWLAENGLETDTLGKKAVAEMLKTAPQPLGDVLSLRQQLAKSSVKKYTAMENAVCNDGRAHGLLQFYGANRTGRWAGRLIQVQNLPQNHLPDLEQARGLVRNGDFEALEMLYDSVPGVLSELIRTAFVPKPGCRFFVADFSAIEARVIAWLAGEKWRMDVFEAGGDIYCQAAEQMFKVPVIKHGKNGHLRQKGKIAELACIAEGQLVLTDRGLVPIEQVTRNDRLWDGESWIQHDGVIYKGERDVIEYEGLTATPDHLVWVEGQHKPVQFGLAAASGSHLIQTGNGRRAIRLGENNQSREKVEQSDEPLLCADPMYGMWQNSMAESKQPYQRKIPWVSKLLPAKTDSTMARQTADSREATLQKSKRPRLSQLWWTGHKIRFFERYGGRPIFDSEIWTSEPHHVDRQDRYQRRLFARKFALCNSSAKLHQPKTVRAVSIQSGVLAVCTERGDTEIVAGANSGRHYTRCGNSSIRKTEKLENHPRSARLYDIRNAGRNHRFTVSGKLVHNCGYGGSVGALKAMGALEMGLSEEELQPLVSAWRQASPHIVRFWWDLDKAAMTAVRKHSIEATHGIRFTYQSSMLFITLPSGRRLAYVKPRIGENQFGSDCVTYEGIGGTKKWERLESYGPKFVENIVQATARDILAEAMLRLNEAGYKIVMHIHDEVVIEAPAEASLETICAIMGKTPYWAKGLLLRADGYVCDYYKKD